MQGSLSHTCDVMNVTSFLFIYYRPNLEKYF